MKGVIVTNPDTGDTFKQCLHCWDTVGQLVHRNMQAKDPLVPDLQTEQSEIDQCQICKRSKKDIN